MFKWPALLLEFSTFYFFKIIFVNKALNKINYNDKIAVKL